MVIGRILFVDGDESFFDKLQKPLRSSGFEVLIDDKVVDKQAVAATGGWQTYVTITSPTFALGTGTHKLRFRSIGNEWNINWFEIKRR